MSGIQSKIKIMNENLFKSLSQFFKDNQQSVNLMSNNNLFNGIIIDKGHLKKLGIEDLDIELEDDSIIRTQKQLVSNKDFENNLMKEFREESVYQMQ